MLYALTPKLLSYNYMIHDGSNMLYLYVSGAPRIILGESHNAFVTFEFTINAFPIYLQLLANKTK